MFFPIALIISRSVSHEQAKLVANIYRNKRTALALRAAPYVQFQSRHHQATTTQKKRQGDRETGRRADGQTGRQ